VSEETVKVRLLFVDDGEYHHETVEIPAASVEAHERLIDCLREDAEVLKRVFVDEERLVSAHINDQA
jgi:hypothetical protein